MSIGSRYVILVILDDSRHPSQISGCPWYTIIYSGPGSSVTSLRGELLWPVFLKNKQTKTKQHKMTHPGLFHSYHLNSIWKYLFLCLLIISVSLDMSSMRAQTLFVWLLLYPWHLKLCLKYSRCLKKIVEWMNVLWNVHRICFYQVGKTCGNDCH